MALSVVDLFTKQIGPGGWSIFDPSPTMAMIPTLIHHHCSGRPCCMDNGRDDVPVLRRYLYTVLLITSVSVATNV